MSRGTSILARVLIAASLMAGLAACEGRDAHVDGPKGASAFGNYVVIGTGLSMGVQSGGVLYESQVESWPSLLAHAVGAGFRYSVTDTTVSGASTFGIPLLRAPGCQPPLVAPLELAVDLSGASTAAPDTTCAGSLDGSVPPTNVLAIAGASAWDALTLTPRIVLNATTPPYAAVDRARYPLVLGSTQSQVTAMRVAGPTFVSVELGLSEVLGAATSGLLVPATSYAQTEPYTYVPASVFAPVFASIADSVALTGARVVVLSVPMVSALYALRPASELWADRAELATFGVNVTADCATSPNLLYTNALVPPVAAQFAATGIAGSLSCTDVTGAADGILTPADVTSLDAEVTQMNEQIRQLALDNGWAFADLTGVYPPPVSARTPYAASDELTCVYPYGALVSLDGVYPSSQGQVAIAATVAAAINAKFGFTISIGGSAPTGTGATAAKLCP